MSQILNNLREFWWYKAKLDVDLQYEHEHIGEPTRYPCKPRSVYYNHDFGDMRNPPRNQYVHEFVYMVETKCPCCGHSRTGWPGEFETTAEQPPKQEPPHAQ